MKNTDLHELFINALHNKIPKRSELTTFISDNLAIERESAARRLAGKVLFTVKEIGILAQKLQISLDNLLNKDKDYIIVPLKMNMPSAIKSFDEIVDQLDGHVELHDKLYEEPSEIGVVFDSIPLEFASSFPLVTKFLLFKWGYYFVGSREFDDFSLWEIPPKLMRLNEDIRANFEQYTSVYYIWDSPVIWNLVKEIRHFNEMHIMSDNDRAEIKKQLFGMLDYIEDLAKGSSDSKNSKQKVSFYVSNANIGMTGYYHFSKGDKFSFIKNYFIQSAMNRDDIVSSKIREWIDEMKRVSTLISGSGAKDRKLFFEEQRNIVGIL